MNRILCAVGIDARLLRYVGAGGFAFIVDYAALLGLTELLRVHYLISATVGFMLGSVVCYALSALWVFDEHRYEQRSTEIALFVFIGICGLGVNNILLWILTDGIEVPYQVSKLLAAGAVLFFNYSARRAFVFSSDRPSAAGSLS